jgi:hypothetical protein
MFIKELAVVVSDVEVDGGFSLSDEIWQQPRTTAIAGCMAARTRGRRSSHGLDGPMLETSVGSAGN